MQAAITFEFPIIQIPDSYIAGFLIKGIINGSKVWCPQHHLL